MPVTNLFDTDVYKDFDRGGLTMTNKIKCIVGKPKESCIIVNEMLAESLDQLRRSIKEAIVLKVLDSVAKGELVLFVAKPEYNLPTCLPFFRYTNAKTGEVKVAVNMTNVVTEVTGKTSTGEGTGEVVGYELNDVNITYTMLVSAYIQLKCVDPFELGTKFMTHAAVLWARMFNKILVKTIGLASSKERYNAYFYFAVRFFLTNLVGAPEKLVDSISLATLKERQKSTLIVSMEDKIKDLGINMYADFTTFCQTLFNNEVSNIRAMRVTTMNPNETINVSFYCRKFIDSYHQGAILALCNPFYFIWMVVAVEMKARLFNIKMCEDIFSKSEMAAMMSGIYTAIN